MARFEVVNSSPGTYWVNDKEGDPRWPNGMGLTFSPNRHPYRDDEILAAKAQADNVCAALNALVNEFGEQNNPDAHRDSFVYLKFQSGPIGSQGVNGTQIEFVLKILIERLRKLNGEVSCRENAVALTHLETALLWLDKRTSERRAQKVEGTKLAHA